MNIKNRWIEDSLGIIAITKIFKVIKKGGELKKSLSPYNDIDNLTDFRGLDLNQIKINRLRVTDADFTESSFSSSFINKSVFQNSIFGKVDFTDFSDSGNEYKACLFSRCRFQKSAIGYKGSNYVNCTFESCNFSGAVFIRGEFDNCKFLNCNLKNIDFNGSSFTNCTFEGKLEGVWFRGGYGFEQDIKEFGKPRKNKMSNVSFENATLIGVNFSNDCELSSVKLPLVGKYKLFDDWNYRLEKLSKEIENWPEQKRNEANIFVSSHLVHSKKQKWFILNIEEVIDDFGKEVTNEMIYILAKD
ncbi:pentapeptide repeat-containing protein [Muricauda brasiliensis]|uniref:pentapeptide repeat-containing protein n=1 Tax=Muricauda brasiliensis TaxID=2162892 RepID=UPI000D3D755F|nr:pentapeptide repeat-containing protein [Muricauda brasiliensis]